MNIFKNKSQRLYFLLAMLASITVPALAFFEGKNIYESKEFLIGILPTMAITLVIAFKILKPDFNRHSFENCFGLPMTIGLIAGFLYPLALSVIHAIVDPKTQGIWDTFYTGVFGGIFATQYVGFLFVINFVVASVIANFYIVSFLTWKSSDTTKMKSGILGPLLGAFLLFVAAKAFIQNEYQSKDLVSLFFFSAAIFLPLFVVAVLGIVEAVKKARIKKNALEWTGVALFSITAAFTFFALITIYVDKIAEQMSNERVDTAIRLQYKIEADKRSAAANMKLAEQTMVVVAPSSNIAASPDMQVIYRYYFVTGDSFFAHKTDMKRENYTYDGPIFQLSKVPVKDSMPVYQCGNLPDFYLSPHPCQPGPMLLGYASMNKTDWAPYFVHSCVGEETQILSTNIDDCKNKKNLNFIGFVGSVSKDGSAPNFGNKTK